MSRTYSLSDIPCRAEDKDEFVINPFAKRLERFITNTDTPITIALQGEWGSGKTSPMNYLQESLCNDSGFFHGVWINTSHCGRADEFRGVALQKNIIHILHN